MFNDYITNFNECKELNSSRLNFFDRLFIGCSAMFGSVHKIQKAYGISRAYVYKLKNFAKSFYDSSEKPSANALKLCNKLMKDDICIVDKSLLKRAVVVLALDAGSSEEGIQRCIENIFGINISIGIIHNILDEAAEKAAEYDAKIDLSNISQGANDEIFQGDMPIFTGVDSVTEYTYLLELNDDRSANTWQKAMDKCKEKGLNLTVSISDCGTGLLSGIPKAFPNAIIQPDLFHWLMELGKSITSSERKVYSLLNEYYHSQEAIKGPKVHKKTVQKLPVLQAQLDLEIERYDRLDTLYKWLRELTAYQGISYEDTLALCEWILDEMEKTDGISRELKKTLVKTRKHLPDVLLYLKRAENALKEKAVKSGYPEDSFLLMYRLQLYRADSIEYRAISKRLKRILKARYEELFFEVQNTINGVKRASSLVENLNGRLRNYINVKRRVPKKFLILLKVYFNTRKFKRSRIAERVGKSPLELLTKQPHPDFYDIVCS